MKRPPGRTSSLRILPNDGRTPEMDGDDSPAGPFIADWDWYSGLALMTAGTSASSASASLSSRRMYRPCGSPSKALPVREPQMRTICSPIAEVLRICSRLRPSPKQSSTITQNVPQPRPNSVRPVRRRCAFMSRQNWETTMRSCTACP